MNDGKNERQNERQNERSNRSGMADGINGPSIQVDPLFPYYANRSADSIAEEVLLAGYRIVHYFVVNENNINAELIRAFHRRGMFVWALVLGNGTFSTEGYPKEWTQWEMKLLKPVEDGYRRFSYFSTDYVRWKKNTIAELLVRHPFDGIEIAEPYFPEWDGIRRGVYGDVGPMAQEAFMGRYGCRMPDFVNRLSPRYYKRDTATYTKWVEFRVDAVNGFVDEMINGRGGARDVRPDIRTATWSLAVDDGPDSASRLREMQGLDAPAMIARVRPDLHMLQTHWPDWVKARLPGDYIRSYESFVRDIRVSHPLLPLGVQADIGSAKTMIKDRRWLHTFAGTSNRLGYATWTAYEYHIGGTMYETRPVPWKAVRISLSEVMISFNKRIDPDSCRNLQQLFGVYVAGEHRPAGITRLQTDGNRLFVRSPIFPAGPFELLIPGIRDTPELWLFKDYKANETAPGSRVSVPACLV